MIVKDFMTSLIVTADTSVLVIDAAKLMAIERIGSLIVTRNDVLEGIVTRQDVLAARLMSDETYESLTVEEIMQSPVVSINPDADLGQLVALMNQTGITHVPVISGDEIIGLVSSSDIIRTLATVKQIADGAILYDEDSSEEVE
ncbi:MAG: CBS domain-containing protein [Candidatus Thorarchaeota archaeon]